MQLPTVIPCWNRELRTWSLLLLPPCETSNYSMAPGKALCQLSHSATAFRPFQIIWTRKGGRGPARQQEHEEERARNCCCCHCFLLQGLQIFLSHSLSVLCVLCVYSLFLSFTSSGGCSVCWESCHGSREEPNSQQQALSLLQLWYVY